MSPYAHKPRYYTLTVPTHSLYPPSLTLTHIYVILLHPHSIPPSHSLTHLDVGAFGIVNNVEDETGLLNFRHRYLWILVSQVGFRGREGMNVNGMCDQKKSRSPHANRVSESTHQQQEQQRKYNVQTNTLLIGRRTKNEGRR